MFDSHKIEVKHPEKVIHEHRRAPTDDSIKLAIEYEEKILKKIVDKWCVADNTLNISFFKVENSLNSYLISKIILNGVEFSEKFNIRFDFNITHEEIIKWISNCIAKPILDEFIVKMNCHFK